MKIIATLLLSFLAHATLAQDSTAYELQRAKINGLLAERSAKFGQYDQSLNARTGIFGWQTKRDLKNSNEILREIAINDNRIFVELKALLDYKNLQVQEVKSSATQSDANLLAYKTTIKNLQQKNRQLQEELDQKDGSSGIWMAIVFILIIAIGLLIYNLYQTNKKLSYESAAL